MCENLKRWVFFLGGNFCYQRDIPPGIFSTRRSSEESDLISSESMEETVEPPMGLPFPKDPITERQWMIC